MTVPLLPFNDLKVWGSPFHGLVKGGELTLPNAETMSYPQPSSGDTYLVKFSGVPAVERTPAQQADDDVAGYEWRTDAIIAANQLHGRGIGSPWLHKDDDGRVWQVTVSHTLGNSVTLTLTEFGVIRLEYVEPEEIVLNITLPDMGLFEVKGITMMDVRPDGNQAVFIAAQANDKAIFTITLAELAATVVVEKPFDEMLVDKSIPETTSTIPDELVNTPTYMRGIYDQGNPNLPGFVPGYIEFRDTPMSGAGMDFSGEGLVLYEGSGGTISGGRYPAFSYITGREEKERTVSEEKFFWANYDAGGALHYYSTIHARYESEVIEKSGDYSGDWYIYADSTTGNPGVTGTMSGSLTLRAVTTTTETQIYTYQLCRDSAVIDEYVVTLSETSESGTERVMSGATPSIKVSEDIIVVDSGGGLTTTTIDTDVSEGDFNGDALEDYLPVDYGGTYYLSNNAKEYTPLSEDLPGFEVIQSTNKLVHMIVTLNYDPGYQIGYHIGPDNADSTRTDVADLDAINATYHPVTGQIVREQSETVSFV